MGIRLTTVPTCYYKSGSLGEISRRIALPEGKHTGKIGDVLMRTRVVVKRAVKVPAPPVERSEAILSGIADLDLFLAHDIRKLLESGPALPPPSPTVQAYQPTRTSVTSS